MISLDQLTVEFGGFTLFDQVSFVINTKDKIGLVGKNGAGKSTLLKIFAGLQTPTKGMVTIPKDVEIGYLPQHMSHRDGLTVLEEATTAFSHVMEMEEKINHLNAQLTERTDYESDGYLKLIEEVTALNERFQILGGTNFHSEIEKTLLGLGFKRSDLNRRTEEFSGGWRMRIELAKILLRRPDVLLLDEPTNHLDIESIQWLEQFLKNHSGAVLLVSHDRAFLDNVTNRTVELELGRIYDYKASYSDFVELRKERREAQIRAYLNQQKMIQETEAFIERFRYKATKAVQVQSRIKQLDKLERIEVDLEDNSCLNLKFPPGPRSGTMVVEAESLEKSYGELKVLDEVDLLIERGEKVAFVGRNGEGKSTLVKCVMGQTDYSGILKVGHNVQIGYFAQNQANLLDPNRTIFETIDAVAQGEIRKRIRDILGAFMFSGDTIDKKVKVLSGGERSRLAMIRLLLEPVNLLVLDEPTNHLDMQSKDVLKEAIKAFEGTVIVVSHDREFLDGLVDKVFEFRNKKIKQHLGGIYEFLQRKNMENLQELERGNQKASKTSHVEETGTKKENGVRLSYEERKEWSKKIRKAEKNLGACEEAIASLESSIEEMDGQLANPENLNDTSLFESYQKTKDQLEEEMNRWEELTLELEELQEAFQQADS